MPSVNKELLSTFANFGNPERLQRNRLFEQFHTGPIIKIREGGAGILNETGESYIWNTPIDRNHVGTTIIEDFPYQTNEFSTSGISTCCAATFECGQWKFLAHARSTINLILHVSYGLERLSQMGVEIPSSLHLTLTTQNEEEHYGEGLQSFLSQAGIKTTFEHTTPFVADNDYRESHPLSASIRR